MNKLILLCTIAILASSCGKEVEELEKVNSRYSINKGDGYLDESNTPDLDFSINTEWDREINFEIK